ncbi:MAG: hypothetical protein ACRCZF_25800, partial [Gemmataceae bacterium]
MRFLAMGDMSGFGSRPGARQMKPELLRDLLQDDESLTSDLDEAEAALLLAALTTALDREPTEPRLNMLRKTGRAMAKVVATARDDSPEAALAELQKRGLPAPAGSPNTPSEWLRGLLIASQL